MSCPNPSPHPKPARRAALAAFLLTASLLPGVATVAPAALAAPDHRAALAAVDVPVLFEPNLGQAGADVRWLARIPGGTLLVGEDLRFVLSGPDGATELRFAFADASLGTADLVPGAPLGGVTNYLVGPDPSAWVAGVPHHASLTARDLWPGVDLALYQAPQGGLEYDFVLAPGADPARVRYAVTGAEGLEVAEGGDLLVKTPGGILRQPAPVVYQLIADGPGRAPVEGAFALAGDGEVGFRIGAFDPARTLVIDPRIEWSSGLPETMNEVAVGADGSIYLGGDAASGGRATPGAFQPQADILPDTYILKLTPQRTVAWATYLGGRSTESLGGLAVDAAGAVIVAGTTRSTDYPTTPGAIQAMPQGGLTDGFLAKLAPGGDALLWSTYLGGALVDGLTDVDLDAAGNAFVAGTSTSANFPTLAAADPTFDLYPNHDIGQDVVVAKVTPAGALGYSTYWGSPWMEFRPVIDVDGAGNAYVAGSVVLGGTFPTTPGAYQATSAGYTTFVTKFAPGGTVAYSTLFGTGALAWDIAADPQGRAIVAGVIGGPTLPLANPVDATYSQLGDAFVARLSASGGALEFSTYLGGSSFEDYPAVDRMVSVATDAQGNIYVGGATWSTDFAVKSAFQPIHGGGSQDAYVVKYRPDGSLAWSSFLGGGSIFGQQALGLTTDASGRVYAVGGGHTEAFPNTHLPAPWGGDGARSWLVIIGPCSGASPATTATSSGLAGRNGWFRSPEVRVGFSVATSCPQSLTYAALDGGDFAAWRQAMRVNGEGIHDLDFYSVDASEGPAEAVRSMAVKIDSIAPTTTATLSGAAGTNGWWRSAVLVSLASSDATSGVDATYVGVDGSWGPGASASIAGDGRHDLGYYAEDIAGNAEAPTFTEVNIDATPPEVRLLQPFERLVHIGDLRVEPRDAASACDDVLPAEVCAPLHTLQLPVAIVIGNVTVRAEGTDATSGIDRVELVVDGQSLARDAPDEFVFHWGAGTLALGCHQLEVHAFDVAGNSAADGMPVLTIPTTPEGVAATLASLPPDLSCLLPGLPVAAATTPTAEGWPRITTAG